MTANVVEFIDRGEKFDPWHGAVRLYDITCCGCLAGFIQRHTVSGECSLHLDCFVIEGGRYADGTPHRHEDFESAQAAAREELASRRATLDA